jgi:SAM-dependent methyltransferase
MYNQSAKYYDALYRALGKDYAREADSITQLLVENGVAEGSTLLDVACGTGKHLEALRDRFACEGLDVSRPMLEIARERNPGVPVHLADMIGFNLGKQYDAIVCLFGSIAYAPNVGRLEQVLQSFARHLRRGGALLLEPWVQPEEWKDGQLHGLFVDEPDLKVARMSVSRSDGSVSVLNFHYMIASSDGIRTFTEPHRLTLFTPLQYAQALAKAGFSASFQAEGFTGNRGLYVATKTRETVGKG